jgi:hypothetical protein
MVTTGKPSFYRLVRVKAREKLRDDRTSTIVTALSSLVLSVATWGVVHDAASKTTEGLMLAAKSIGATLGAAIVPFVITYVWKYVAAMTLVFEEYRDETDRVQREFVLHEKRPEITLSQHLPALGPITPVTTEVPITHDGHKIERRAALITTPFGVMDLRRFQRQFIANVRNVGQSAAQNIEIDFPAVGGLKITFEVPPLQPQQDWPLLSDRAEYRDGVQDRYCRGILEFLHLCDERSLLSEPHAEDYLAVAQRYGQKVFSMSVRYTDRNGNRYEDCRMIALHNCVA